LDLNQLPQQKLIVFVDLVSGHWGIRLIRITFGLEFVDLPFVLVDPDVVLYVLVQFGFHPPLLNLAEPLFVLLSLAFQLMEGAYYCWSYWSERLLSRYCIL